jgi:hypothetical protein
MKAREKTPTKSPHPDELTQTESSDYSDSEFDDAFMRFTLGVEAEKENGDDNIASQLSSKDNVWV